MVEHAKKPKQPTVAEQIEKWNRLIWRYTLRIGNRHAIDPADVHSDIVVTLLRKHASYNPKWSYSTWLSAIARRVSGRYHEQGRRRIREVQIEDVSASGGDQHSDRHTCLASIAIDRSPDPSDEAAANEQAARVRNSTARVLA